jgi:hypothetical protein
MVECLKGYKTKSETELFLEINGETFLPAVIIDVQFRVFHSILSLKTNLQGYI